MSNNAPYAPTVDRGAIVTDAERDFPAYFAATWPRMYRTALAIAGDSASAEDACQAAFAKVYASWRRVSAADHPDAYVRRMVVNEVLSTRRSARWRRERPHADVGEPPPSPSAEDGLVERDSLWPAVVALAPRQRAVIVLRYYEDLSEQQIADALGCSRGTVKSQAAAALANLRRATGAALPEGDLS
ncbi:MAG: SigE family RNA polymerase sigma factor [Nocardioides sp.]|uniref:SigE family RNA polymerase sigma factor n=1 Tax=Nocardioides sp. TaxID=35761 RepID=UPI0032673881